MVKLIEKPTDNSPAKITGLFNQPDIDAERYIVSFGLKANERMNGNRLTPELTASLFSKAVRHQARENHPVKTITNEQRLGVFFMQYVYDNTDYCDTEILDIAPYIVKMAKKVCSIKHDVAPTHEAIDTMLGLNRVKHSENPAFVSQLERAADCLHAFLDKSYRRFNEQLRRPYTPASRPERLTA